VLRSDVSSGQDNSVDHLRKTMEGEIEILLDVARQHDARAVRKKLKDLVCNYSPQENETVL